MLGSPGASRGLAITRDLPEQRHLAPGVARQRAGVTRRLAEARESLDRGGVLAGDRGPGAVHHRRYRGARGLAVQGPVPGGRELGGAALEHAAHQGPLVPGVEAGQEHGRRLAVCALVVPGPGVDDGVAALLAAGRVGGGRHVGARPPAASWK